MKYFFCLLFLFILSFSYSQNTHKIDSLLICLKKTQADSSKVNCLNELSIAYRTISNYDTALYYATAALQLSQQLAFKRGIAKANNRIGNIYLEQADYSKALDYYLKALKIDQELNNKSGIGKQLGNIGIIYFKQGDYSNALNYCFNALSIAEELGEKNEIAAQLGNIGNAYGEQGDYSKTLDYYFKALTILEELGNKNRIGMQLTNIGAVYDKQDDYPKALSYYFKALHVCEETGNKRLRALLLVNIGTVYIGQKNYSRALDYCSGALKISEEIGDKNGIMTELNNIGLVYDEQKKYNPAIDCYFRALKMGKELGDKRHITINLANIGDLYTTLSRYADAYIYLYRALAISDSIGAKNEVQMQYGNLSDLYEKSTVPLCDSMGGKLLTVEQMRLRALYYYKRSIAIRDTLFSQENKKQLVRKEMNYEFEKKEEAKKAEHDKEMAVAEAELRSATFERNAWVGSALALLMTGLLLIFYLRAKRRNEKISMEKQLIELEQKALSLQMNPHFIFNSLNSISSFISQNDPVSAKKYLSKFASLMRLILENSRESFIPLQQEIDTLTCYLDLEQLRFENKFNFQIQVAPGIETDALVIPPMLIQPQIENAILHGLLPKEEGKGKISVFFYLKENEIICEIEDNGVGRKKAAELNYHYGESHKSLALQVTEERLEVINAQTKDKNRIAALQIIDLQDEQNNSIGTKVILNLPVLSN